MKYHSNTIEEGSAPSGQKQKAGQSTQRNWRHYANLAVIGLAAVLLVGCAPGKYTGGGFIDSTAGGDQKATFGFELEGIDATGSGQVTLESAQIAPLVYEIWGLAKGQCTYNDHGAGVQFHFDCVPMTSLPADGSPPSGCFFTLNNDGSAATGAIFSGPYNSPAGSGEVFVSITCIGDQYLSTSNTLTIQLFGGPYDGYFNSGTIQGGSMQFHPTF